MSDPTNNRDKTRMEALTASLIMLGFGLGILAFLIAIERPEWFHIRPLSGTAAAMSHAASLGTGQPDARVDLR